MNCCREEFDKFLMVVKPQELEALPAFKRYFKAYATRIASET
jgi:hypothetical protein